jgi:hypothetical protein
MVLVSALAPSTIPTLTETTEPIESAMLVTGSPARASTWFWSRTPAAEAGREGRCIGRRQPIEEMIFGAHLVGQWR